MELATGLQISVLGISLLRFWKSAPKLGAFEVRNTHCSSEFWLLKFFCCLFLWGWDVFGDRREGMYS